MKVKWWILGVVLTGVAAVVVTLAVLGGIRLRQYAETNLFGPRRAMSSVQQGHEAMMEGNYDQAIRDFTAAIRLNPRDPRMYLYRGLCYSSQGKWNQAKADYTEAIRLDPSEPNAFEYRGYAHNQLFEWDQAISDFNQAIRIEPDNARAYGSRGHAHARKGDTDQALRDYEKSLDLEPNAPMVHVYRGQIWQRKSETAKASEEFKTSLKLGATNAMVLNELAWMLATSLEASERNGQVAIEGARKACELTKWKDWHCVDTLAAAYAEAGDFEQAAKYQKQCLTMPDLTEHFRPEAEERLALFEKGQPYRETPKSATTAEQQ